MNIQIKQLTLQNFKCFREKEITFDSEVTTIRGRNGAGKTTIADAILWCLFGKNTQGQSDFDLKTHDADGKPIPNLDHSVEIELNVLNEKQLPNEGMIKNSLITSDYNITLKRTLKETWIKKRGSDEQVFKNNTTEYMVNGEVKTAADYKKFITQLIDEDIFKAITNPQYFPSLKWQVQREFLTKMVGEITEDDFTKYGDDDELYNFRQMLAQSDDDIISYRKHLSYQIKQIKDKLDKIPVRLDEQNKALPEKLDWGAISSESESIQSKLKALGEKIVTIKSGNGGDVLREEIRAEIKTNQDKLYTIENTEHSEYYKRKLEHDNKISEASHRFNQLVATQRDIEKALPSFDRMIERCKDTLNQCEKDAQVIRNEWNDNLSRTLQFSDQDSFCPTCGQYLPKEQVAENRKKALESLNSDKALIKKMLTERASKVKQLISETEEEINNVKQKKLDTEKALEETKESINQVFSEKAKLEKESILTIDQALAENKDYQKHLQIKEELIKKLDSICVGDDSKEQLAELESEKCLLEAELTNCQHQLASKEQYDKVTSLIEGINAEQKDLVKQLSELERKEDVARRYQDRQNTILESHINEHFSLVKWKLFRTVNNGGDPFDEPFCECYVDGVAYHDGLNQAARLNAGLDIINTLCKHYNVSAPIVLDNSESTINIIGTIGQQVRLQVADTDLQIE